MIVNSHKSHDITNVKKKLKIVYASNFAGHLKVLEQKGISTHKKENMDSLQQSLVMRLRSEVVQTKCMSYSIKSHILLKKNKSQLWFSVHNIFEHVYTYTYLCTCMSI